MGIIQKALKEVLQFFAEVSQGFAVGCALIVFIMAYCIFWLVIAFFIASLIDTIIRTLT